MKALENLSFAQLLRYFFCGVVFLAAFRYSRHPDPAQAIALPPEIPGGLLLVLTGLSGSVIYILYRAILYPALARGVLWAAMGFPRRGHLGYLNVYKPLESEMTRDEARWKRRESKSGVQTELDNWGSEVHFLYGVSLATAVGSILGCFFFPLYGGQASFSWLLFDFIALTFCGGLLTHYRLRVLEERQLRNDHSTNHGSDEHLF